MAIRSFFFILMCCFGSLCQAAIVFSVTPTLPTIDLTVGSTQTFNVFARSDTGFSVPVSNIDLNITAGVGNASQGVFTSATGSLFPSSNGNWDLVGTPGQAFFSRTLVGSTVTVLSTNTLIGTVTLDATGVPDGTYDLLMDQLNALDANFIPITSIAFPASGIVAQYTITGSAIPEPTSLALAGVVCVLTLIRRQRRKSLA